MQELAVLAARTMAMQKQFTAIADNVANATTHGYKRLDVNFREVVSRPRGHATASYVADSGVRVDYAQGGMEQTGNPLDVALGGEGFFAVQVGNTIQYTRKGQFMLNSDGQLTTPSGNLVLDNAKAPIQFAPDVKTIYIGPDGTVSTDKDGQIDQLGVFTFSPDDGKKLQRTGDANFLPPDTAQALPVETPVVKQGMLEASNVNSVQEMVTMEQVSQAYQNSVKLMGGLEDLEDSAIKTLGGVQ